MHIEKPQRRLTLKALLAAPLGVAVFGAASPAAATAPPNRTGGNMSEELMSLVAHRAIVDVLYRYARGWDRLDEEALRSCFFADSAHQHGAFKGRSQDFITAAFPRVSALKSTSHLITNPLVDVRGDRAFSECYFLAHHRRQNAAGTDEEDYFVQGRYIDRFERRNGEWKIARRRGVHDFERIAPRAEGAFASAPAEQRGARKPHDPLYDLLADFTAEP